MFNLIILGLSLLSLSAFSQSYVILQNGVTLTTDKAGFVYDFNNFILPYKVNVNGTQYLVEDDMLATIDENGFFYRKDLNTKKIRGKGGNYLLTYDYELVTVDSKGFYYKYDSESYLVFRKIQKFGGSYFTAEASKKQVDLYTVNSKGNYFKLAVEGLNPANIEILGGTYFTADGVLYTVSKDGFVFSKATEVSKPQFKRLGGNYFVDTSDRIYTISEEGLLIFPSLPANFKLSKITKIGTNYLIDSEGRIFVVDKNGNLFDRGVTSHNLRNAKVLSNWL